MTQRHKAEWAARKARDLHRQVSELRADRIPSGDWRKVRRKMEAVRRLEAEAYRFEAIARRYREAA